MSDFSVLFDRKADIIFGKPLVGEELTRVPGLFIQFDIEKTTESDANSAKIKVYNLNQRSRGILVQNDTIVQLDVGYGNALEQLFIGDVDRVTIEKKGPDIVAFIEAGDSEKTLLESTINQSFAPGTFLSKLVNIAASKLNVAVGTLTGLKDKRFEQGVTLSGNVKTELDKLLKAGNVEWNIQDGTLQILPENETTGEDAILLNKNTGLLGRPIRKNKGISFRSLLIPDLKPGRKVRIFSDDIDGDFKIRKSNFKGDTRVGPFEVTCEADFVAPITFFGTSLNINTLGVA